MLQAELLQHHWEAGCSSYDVSMGWQRRECMASQSSFCSSTSHSCIHSGVGAEQVIFQAPKKGPKPDSQYDHTSMLATAKEWFGLGGFLTDRDAWAGTFSELLLDAPRPDSDMPLHLPTPPKPATPWHPWPPSKPPPSPPSPPPPRPSPLPEGKQWECVEDALLDSTQPGWRVAALGLSGVDYTKGFSGDIASCQAVCNGACVKNGPGTGKAPCRALEFHFTDRHCVCYDGPKSFTYDEFNATAVGHQKHGSWSTCMLTPPDPPGWYDAIGSERFINASGKNLTSSTGPRRRLLSHTSLLRPQLDDPATAPQHCSQSTTPPGACQGPHVVTQKQRNLMELYAALTQAPLPDVENMGYVDADVWTRARWNEYMAMLQ